MHPTLVGTGPSVASSSYPFIFRPPLPSAILRDGHPFNSPGTLVATFLNPLLSSRPICFSRSSSSASSSFSLATGHRSILAKPPRALFYDNNTNATTSFRCASITTSVRARTVRFGPMLRGKLFSLARSRREGRPLLARALRNKHRGVIACG